MHCVEAVPNNARSRTGQARAQLHIKAHNNRARLHTGASSIGASPGLMAAAVGSLKKNRPSPVVSATKSGVIDGDSESVWVR